MLTAIPTLDDLARDSRLAVGLSVEVIAGLLAKHAAVGNALGAALIQPRPERSSRAATIDKDDTMIEPEEAATILHRKRRWIYRNADRLPFVRRMSTRSLLCSKNGVLAWLAAQKP